MGHTHSIWILVPVFHVYSIPYVLYDISQYSSVSLLIQKAQKFWNVTTVVNGIIMMPLYLS